MLDAIELVRRMAGLERRVDKLTAMGRGRYIGCRLAHSAAQSTTNGVALTLTWDTEEGDDDGMHDAGAPTRVVLPLDGVYRIVGQAPFDANATGFRTLVLARNGAGIREVLMPAVSGVRTTPILAAEIVAAAGDYVELVAFQNSGATLGITPGTQQGPYFAVSLSR
jgi:hypothetical protein